MATKLRETASDDPSGPRRTLALVLNDKAGALLAAGSGGALGDLAAAAGFELVPLASGTLPQRLAAARESGADVVAVAGGDGSVACAAETLVGTGIALGIIPCGTMNLLAKDLRIPIGDPGEALRRLGGGERRQIDVGVVGGQIFLCAVMMGTPARLGHHREEGRRRGNGFFGWLHFGRALVRALHRHRALRLTISIDGKFYRLRTPSLTITVNALDDSTAHLFGRTMLDGGEVFVYVVQHRSVLGLIRVLLSALRNRVGSDQSVRVLHGHHVRIGSANAALRVLVDGEEHLLATPLAITIKPRALAVIA
jgi:diacylglycerol kinase family enzyme